jgi:adenylate cyclase
MGLLQRLKQRKIIQWALAYLAGAFVVFQLIDALETPLGLTTTIQQAVLAIVVVGFFITLVLAWYHGEKGRQKVSGPELLMVAALLVVAGVALSTLGGGEETLGELEATAPLENEDARPSLAVLPLENLSPNPQDDYFADGVQEDITTALARISSLSVRGRSSVEQYRESRPGIREMAGALGVDFILEGSARVVGTVAKVTVQLIDGRLDEHVWQDEWEVEYLPDEAIRIQGEIAQEVANLLRIEITPQEESRIAAAPTGDSEAQRLYHRARYRWNRRNEPDVRESIRLFREAIRRDPEYAEAYAGLANAFWTLGDYSWALPDEAYPQAMAAAERALELDAYLPDVYATLGGLNTSMRNWAVAESHFRQSLAMDPDNAFARYWYSLLLDGQGRHDEALEQATLAMELDPLAPQIGSALLNHYWSSREFDLSIAEGLRQVQSRPDFANGWDDLAYSYLAAGQYEKALEAFERVEGLRGEPSGIGKALILACQGDREGALGEVARVQALLGLERINPIVLAELHIALGDFDEGLRLLYRARDEGSPSIHWLTYDSLFDPVRSDPRFIALMEELNLPIIEYQ